MTADADLIVEDDHKPVLAGGVDVAGLAAELRVVLGSLVRQLRMQYRFGLTHAAVLARLYRSGPQCIGELATAERVRPQSMSQTLAELEQDGLIERGPDLEDGRRTRVELTAQGRTALEADRAARDGWLAGELAKLDDADQETLARAVQLLARLTDVS